MALRRSRSFGSGSKRQTTWVGPADQAFVAVGSTNKVLVASFDPASASLPKPTVIRTRGEIYHRPTNLNADLAYVGAWGLAVVSDQAFAAGAASIPGPFDSADWDGWFAWGSFGFHLDFGTNVGLREIGRALDVDSKGMRKISDNETIVFMAESQTGAYSISMPLRLLMKLS